MLLNLALIGIEALVRGGTLDIGAELRSEGGGSVSEIVVRATGPKIAFDPVIGRALDGALARGRTVQPHRACRDDPAARGNRKAAGCSSR